MLRPIALTLILLLSACATRRTTPGFRFINSGPAAILIPPGVSAPTIPSRTFDFSISGPVPKNCRTRDGAIRVEPHARYLRIRVDREALIAQSASWLATWTADLQRRGCLALSETAVLAEQIVESVPINPTVAWRLLHPAAYGSVDLVPGYRLKLVSPIVREGAPASSSSVTPEITSGTDAQLSVTLKSSPDFLGYEVSWYEIQPSGTFAFAAAESHLGQQVVAERSPRVTYFSFPPTTNHYRLFYLTRSSHADHNTAILASATPAELIRLTPTFADDSTACDKAPAHTCVTLPKDVGLTIYLSVTMNGNPRDVPVDGTVADALRAAGVPQPASVLPSLTIRRRYKSTTAPVEFDRAKPDILTLKLIGREDIRW